MKHLFISRNLGENGPVTSYCEQNNIFLTALPLIDFRPRNTSMPSQHFDVVFFTSPRSVHFFFEQFELSEDKLYATIGAATSEALQTLGKSPSFIGEKSTEPEKVAEDFKNWLKDKVVIIPQSDRSNKTIENVMSKDQVIPLVIYETVLKPTTIDPAPDVVVLSSPSNAAAFFQANHYFENQIYIAFGTTTADYLDKNHQIHAFVPSGLNEDQLLDLIIKLDITNG